MLKTKIILLLFTFISLHCYANTEDIKNKWKNYYLAVTEGIISDEPDFKFPYDKCFRDAAEDNNIPLTVLLAVARGESDFNPDAGLGKKGHNAYGIMQIQWFDDKNSDTARDLGFTSKNQLFEPCENIKAGAKYIAWLLKAFDNNMYKAIAAYNIGIGNMQKGLEKKAETFYSNYIYHHLKTVAGQQLATLDLEIITTQQLASLDNKQTNVPTMTGEKIKASEKAEAKVESPRAEKVYIPKNKLVINRFYSANKALNFMKFLQSQDNSLKIEWFGNNIGETYIVMLYESPDEKSASLKKLENIGFIPSKEIDVIF